MWIISGNICLEYKQNRYIYIYISLDKEETASLLFEGYLLFNINPLNFGSVSQAICRGVPPPICSKHSSKKYPKLYTKVSPSTYLTCGSVLGDSILFIILSKESSQMNTAIYFT